MILTGILIFVIFTVTGAIIKYGQQHWLIAGYNTMPEEKKKNVDIAGLASFLGNWLFALGTLTLVGSLICARWYPSLSPCIPILCPAGIIVMVVGAQKYDHNQRRKREKTVLTTVMIFTGLVLIAAAGLMLYGHRSSPVELESDGIVIGGIYSTTIPREEITGIELKEELPEIISKNNGFSSGQIRKGHFTLEELGRGRLYLESNRGPFIYILTGDSHVLINYQDPLRTEALYKTLLDWLD